MVSLTKYSIQKVVNWYYGNFCTRKCFDKEERMLDCYKKMCSIVESTNNMLITHKEFKDMIDNDLIKICKLKPSFRRRTIGWKQFERWHRDPDYDSDKME